MVAKTNIIYLQKDKFQFFSSGDGKIYEFRFVPEVIRDLDVINIEMLENLIKVFVTNGKIAPSNLVIVLSENAYFSKDFVPPPAQKAPVTHQTVTRELLQNQAEEFVEHVPFDNVVSKMIPLKEGFKVIATNKDFYESIAIAFEHLSFKVEAIVPGVVLGNGLSLRPVLDSSMAGVILQKINTVKQYDLLNQQVFQPQVKQETEEVDEVEVERNQVKKQSKKRLFGLVGVFASLLIVLVIVYVQSQTPPTPPKQPANASTENPTPQVAAPVVLATPLPTTTTTNSTGNLSTQDLTVQIVDASSSSSAAQQLMGRLDTYKFKSVSLQTSSQTQSATTLVSFSPETSQEVRDVVLGEVKKLDNNVSVQEKQIGTYDISVVLAE
ncbi:MAG TPA: hypothetical protein VLF93_06050 [Candidatus Saccharimonadales bacterium]|nr:hypothetical protein [Candidatus Saccharimonadales bacterium]